MSGNLSRAGEASFAGNGLGRIRLALAKSDNDDRPVEIVRQSVKRSRAHPLGECTLLATCYAARVVVIHATPKYPVQRNHTASMAGNMAD